jgi:hypothetical protein
LQTFNLQFFQIDMSQDKQQTVDLSPRIDVEKSPKKRKEAPELDSKTKLKKNWRNAR